MRAHRFFPLLWLFGLVSVAKAQVPNVRFHLDLYGTYDSRNNNTGTLHLYNPLGNASTIQISAEIEPELRAFLSERLEQFPRDPSHDPLEQYYVEDQGIWRLGKQYLPFGAGALVRENVLAASGQTKLLIENTTLNVALCDGGAGNQQGIIGRLGSKLGVSAAYGEHFGISPTSLDLVRSPAASPGSGRGWREMVGADGSRVLGQFTTSAEAVWLLNADSLEDRSQLVWDASETYKIDMNHWVLAGYSHSSDHGDGFIRIQGHIPWTKMAAVEPLLRFENGKFLDLALTVQVRL